MSLAVSLRRAALALALSAPCALANGVRIVDPSGQKNFPDVQSAIDAAVDGDVLLLGAGAYTGFTVDGKGLSILAAPGTVGISGTVTVTNVASRALLSGLGIGAGCAKALSLTGCSGVVTIQNCNLTGGSATTPTGCGYGHPAAAIAGCAAVVVSSCSFSGGNGLFGYQGTGGGPGMPGLLVSNANLAAYASTFHGGNGGNSEYEGGNGGDGLQAVSSSLFASRCSFAGGAGGGGIQYYDLLCGVGGAGLELDAGSAAHLLQNSSAGGPGGTHCSWGGGSEGPYSGGGIFDFLPGSARAFDVATITFDRAPWTVPVSGVAGDQVFVNRSLAPVFQYDPALLGVCTSVLPPFATVAPAGVLPGSGTLTLSLRQRLLPDDVPARVHYLQGWVIETGGASVLGSPMHVLSLNWNSPPDCNGNGIQDYAEALFNLTPDADHDLIPDDCP